MKKALFLFLMIFLTACSNDKIDETVIEEQEIVYECEVGYQLVGTECIKTIETIPQKENYTCPSGYQLYNNICTKTEYANSYQKLTCPAGQELVLYEGNKTCYSKISIPMHDRYWCLSGYTLSGNVCIKYEYVEASFNYNCYENEYYDSTMCKLLDTYRVCPAGYMTIEHIGDYVTCARYPKYEYGCPSGYIRKGGVCVKETITPAKVTETCDSDYIINLEEKACKKYIYSDPITTIYCENGYVLSGNTCLKTITENPYINYYCDEGYDHIGNECIKYEIKEAIKK